MRMMGSREDTLKATLATFQETGVSLIWRDPIGGLHPSGFGDDVGIYYLIPKLASLLGQPVEVAAETFYSGLMLGSLVLGVVGGFLIARRWATGLIFASSLVYFARYLHLLSDVYVVQACMAIGFSPWILWACRRQALSLAAGATLLVSGVVLGAAHLTRYHSGTPLLLLAGAVLACERSASWRHRVVAMALLVIGFSVPLMGLARLDTIRNDYLMQQGFPPTDHSGRHPVWHPIYLGLAFLDNPHVPKYDDSVADHAASTSSHYQGYLQPGYEEALREKFFEVWRKDRVLVETTIFAKLGVVTYFLIKSAHLGLLAAWWRRKPVGTELGFWLAIGFTALNGVLVMPIELYLLGLTAMATVYGGVSLLHAVDEYWPVGRKAQLALTVTLVGGVIWLTWSTGHNIKHAFRANFKLAAQEAHSRMLLAELAAGRLPIEDRQGLADLKFEAGVEGAQLQQAADSFAVQAHGLDWGHQAVAQINTVGASAIVVEYAGELPRGSMGIGVLNGAGQWAVYRSLGVATSFSDKLVVAVDGDERVQLVIENQQTSDSPQKGTEPSQCRLSKLEVGFVRR
jgi:hypothetical protein